ncbi:MAG: cation:proton antiporter [Nitrosospira sp.]|nr:cation:proton antiporter [Nitrosospira sp.]MBI0414975.1 cation:proton antiporter [Nitrosospira sp.]MBI0416920.1 cation:proton antiporter [Nitrosospira sp.]MBI0417836.1 cation:proton antiporter [Nitrosospira sp.]
MLDSLPLVLALLISSVFLVWLFRYFKLPAIIAYFTVGLILGPHCIGVLPDSESSRHVAEFGIVFLMFSIGLEFSLPKLHSMRNILFGLGGAQVLITLLTSMGLALWSGLDLTSAFVIGSAFTMSSTAIVSKILMQRIDLDSRHGRLAIGILIFQDIVVIPILILIPALGVSTNDWSSVFLMSLLKIIFLFFILFKFGKPVISFWFSVVANQRSRELFIMNVLMITLLFSFATKMAGLSYSIGAFMAGMLISETRYRYQVESDIAAFRDLLLGLFFISIGMLLNINEIASNISYVILITFGFILFKAFVISLLTRLFNYEIGVGIRTGLILAQAGEFSFVILSLARNENLIGANEFQVILAASLFSMILAPFIIQYNGRIARYLSKSYSRNSADMIQAIESTGQSLKGHVILCGYGRSGQYLARFLKEENISFIAIDIDPSRVSEASAGGEHVMYGDASRRVVLEAAGIKTAKMLVITYTNLKSCMKLLNVIQDTCKDIPVIVRTRDDTYMDDIRSAGASEVVPETLEGSLMLASHALIILGVPLNRVVKRIRSFRKERYKLFKGYFSGMSDAETEAKEAQLKLHTIEIHPKSHVYSWKLIQIPFTMFNVELKYLRRPNMLEDIKPRDDIILSKGDILVVLGTMKEIDVLEKYILTGK